MYPPRLYLVNFVFHDKRVVVSPGTNLLDAAHRAGIDIGSICGGQRECGECRIVVLDGQVTDRTQEEIVEFSEAELEEGYRLACCARVYGPVKVRYSQQIL